MCPAWLDSHTQAADIGSYPAAARLGSHAQAAAARLGSHAQAAAARLGSHVQAAARRTTPGSRSTHQQVQVQTPKSIDNFAT